MKSASNKHLRRKLLCALVAGALAAPFAAQTAYALPIEGANAATNKTAADISTTGAVMDITGKTEHNILRWEDFSIEQNEKVRFDGGSQTRDYLNLVTGEGASNIYGTIEGGRNVYLVNPHGILFAKGSEVNTGALYLSTANPADIATATNTFKTNGTSPLSATAQTGDVLNLGTVKTSKLYIEGKKVTVLKTDAVTNANGTALTGSAVTIRSEDAPHIGYDVGHKTTENIDVNGAATPYQVFDYASTNADHHKASASARGWDVANRGGTAHTDYDYMRVHDIYDLQNINAKRDGRYILANDIDATETQDWNSGEGFQSLGDRDNEFTGRLDGAGHTLRGLYINPLASIQIGLFGTVKEATIENLSLRDGNVKAGIYVGGIVGVAEKAVIRNVSYSGTVAGINVVGGIAGQADKSSTFQNVCNTGTVNGTRTVGGIAGYIENSSLQNVCNTGTVNGTRTVGGIAGYIENSRLQNAWNAGMVTGSQQLGGIVGKADGGSIRHAVSKAGSAGQAVGASSNGADVTTDVKFAAEADMMQAATYADWKDEHGNAVVATEGGKGTPWRIYDGHTMPLLTGLMKGTKRLAKVYDGNVFATTDAHITLVHTGKDVGTYDAYSDQFGYDLIGGATITQRVLTMSGVAAQSKTYDGTTAADAAQFHATLNNVVAGEESLVQVTATGAAYNSKDVATADKVSYTGVALGGTGAGNYRIAAATAQGAGTITRRALTLGTVTAQTKTYDGTTSADASQFHAGLNNVVAGEESSVTATAAGAAYNDKNVAGATTVGYTGIALTGTGAGNYTIATTAEGRGTITRRALTLGEVTAQTKTYDGTRAADTSKFRAALGNTVAGDNVTAAAATATFNDKNVAAANHIDYTGVALAGADAGNYSLAATTAQGAGTIAKRALTIGAVATQTKTYDGSDAADASQFHATLGNLVAGEENLVTATAAGASYNDKNVAGANAVSYTGIALTGTGAGNYTIATTADGRGTITRRALTLGAVAAQTKTYDGTTDADTSKFGAVLNNVVAGEENLVKATASGAAYNSKDVATAGIVSYTGVALAGAEAGNYTLAATTAQGAGSITRRALTVDTVAAQSKTYDGNTAADTSKFQATLNNVVAGEENSVKATAAGAAYNDKNVAAANKVIYTGLALTGAGVGNYSIVGSAEGQGRIAPKQLTLDSVGSMRFDKIYDGNANVTQALAKGTNYTLTGFVSSEGTGITVTGTGTYTDKNAATDKAVTFHGLTLAGTGAGNYTLDKTSLTGTGTIERRTLTLVAAAGQTFDKVYDGTTHADAAALKKGGDYTLSNFVDGEGAGITVTSTGSYADKNVGTHAVNYTGLTLTGTGAENYVLNTTTLAGTGTITHRDLTLIADTQSIVQGEALPSFTGHADGFADGEDERVFGTDALTFDAAVTNTGTLGSYGVTGRIGSTSEGLLGNYRIRQAAGNATAFTIHAAALPGGLLASLVQDAKPVFDDGFSKIVYLFGTPRPVHAATLGLYRFDAERGLEIQGLSL